MKNTNKDGVKELSLRDAIKLAGNFLTAYVLPAVDEVEDPSIIGETFHHYYKYSFLLSCFIDGEFYLIKTRRNLEELGEEKDFLGGSRLELSIKDDEIIITSHIESIAPLERRVGAVIKYSKKKKVLLTYGQKILIVAPPKGGKSYKTQQILEEFKSRKRTTLLYKVLFGERKDDDLGKGTYNCNSSTTVNHQLYSLYKQVTLALRDSHRGMDVVLALDSLTRMVEVLTNMYSHTHMISGGISSSVKTMVSKLFRIAGQTGSGTLTIVGTCLVSSSNNSWKVTKTELASVANAEFFPHIRSGEKDDSRREPIKKPRSIKIPILGLEIEYS